MGTGRDRRRDKSETERGTEKEREAASRQRIRRGDMDGKRIAMQIGREMRQNSAVIDRHTQRDSLRKTGPGTDTAEEPRLRGGEKEPLES